MLFRRTRSRDRSAQEVSPSLEIHIPISPTPLFANMVHYFVHSLRVYGGRYRNAKVVLTVGEQSIDRKWERRNAWIARHGIEVRWLPEALYRKWEYYATAVERFRYRFDSDMVLILDADVLVRRPFEEMVDRCFREQSFAGLITHTTPLPDGLKWQDLYDSAGIGEARLVHEHTGWGYLFSDSSKRYCPPYFNLGVLCGPGAVMNAIGERVYDYMDAVDRVFPTAYKCQMAVGMAVDALDLPYWPLPMRFNFANDPHLEALHPTELPVASILHVLRDHQNVSKNRLFGSEKAVEELLAREDLRNVNEMIQQTLRTIQPLVSADS